MGIKYSVNYLNAQAVWDHREFDTLCFGGVTRIKDRWYSTAAGRNKDQLCGAVHGTHVAALAAGLTFGAAKEANIVSGVD